MSKLIVLLAVCAISCGGESEQSDDDCGWQRQATVIVPADADCYRFTPADDTAIAESAVPECELDAGGWDGPHVFAAGTPLQLWTRDGVDVVDASTRSPAVCP